MILFYSAVLGLTLLTLSTYFHRRGNEFRKAILSGALCGALTVGISSLAACSHATFSIDNSNFGIFGNGLPQQKALGQAQMNLNRALLAQEKAKADLEQAQKKVQDAQARENGAEEKAAYAREAFLAMRSELEKAQGATVDSPRPKVEEEDVTLGEKEAPEPSDSLPPAPNHEIGS